MTSRYSDKAGFRKLVRELAENSNNITMTPHAKSRMRQRKISMRQVVTCLRVGIIEEGPAPQPDGDWRATMHVLAAGEPISVVVELEGVDNPDTVIVITTMRAH